VSNTAAYYNTATITAVKCFIVLSPRVQILFKNLSKFTQSFLSQTASKLYTIVFHCSDLEFVTMSKHPLECLMEFVQTILF
jgi:hypothetical protein